MAVKVYNVDDNRFIHNGDQKPRVQNTNPDGLYTATGVRNAIQGDGFLPGMAESEHEPPAKKYTGK